MPPATERRALQLCVAIACLVPLLTGGSGIIEGPAMLAGVGDGGPIDLDSHYRYLSGLLLGIGLGFLYCIPRIEARTLPFRMLGALAVIGGLGRLLSLIEHGMPGAGHLFGLAMELVVVPLLMLWQARVARRSAEPR